MMDMRSVSDGLAFIITGGLFTLLVLSWLVWALAVTPYATP